MNSVTLLLSSFHDPEARLLPIVRRLTDAADPLGAAWARLRGNYAGLLAVYSETTDPRSVALLGASGWDARRGVDGVDRGLWRMVDLGLAHPVERIQFCDLDRLLHWLERYPAELLSLPERWNAADVTMLVRTPRAFASHPECQTLTEGLANQVIAHRLGLPRADAFSGSYVWSRRAAHALSHSTVARDLRFYAEAVVGPFRAGCTVAGHVVEGLEWETPDQYPAEIAQLGYAAWLATFESPAQWRHRVEMAQLFVEAALA
jgi:hypothetical protein